MPVNLRSMVNLEWLHRTRLRLIDLVREFLIKASQNPTAALRCRFPVQPLVLESLRQSST